MQVIILAGGLGTRLRPLTDATPKPLLPVKGKPIIEHAILNFAKHGIKDIILSVGYHAQKIRDYFGNGEKWGVKIDYAIETEPLGTGGAIKRAAQGLAGTFLAINGDNLADFDWTEMLSAHRESGAQITLALFPVEDVTQYGIARLDGSKILEFIEKPTREAAPTNLNNAGGYIFEHTVLTMLPDGKCSIEKDCFEKLAPSGVVFAHHHTSQWYPTDTLEKYKKADSDFFPLL
ncbi:MAG: nucleotidyltransferase family protein [Candidatus Magasanikbacteria bacterium]|nr:nucleotidyltransferase family protein [Candidatus Magasanikbacteria bacterium]